MIIEAFAVLFKIFPLGNIESSKEVLESLAAEMALAPNEELPPKELPL
jgi:hypothetical protein